MKSLNDRLYQIFRDGFVPKHKFNSGTKKKYHISMNNLYINSSGNVYKKQLLESDYTRTIIENMEDAIFFTNYQWNNMFYTNMLPKQPKQKMEWEFAKGRSFNSHVILNRRRLSELTKEDENEVSEEDFSRCFTSLEKCYEGLPKLPSVYLVVMQTFDILAFDNYLSYIHAQANENGGWKVDEWVHISPPELEHCNEVKIGMGIYSDSSFYKNGLFYLRFLGYSFVNQRIVALFDYYCDFSKAMMSQRQNEKIRRNGTSYYHGQIWIDQLTGDCIRATMVENYYALQEGEKQKSVNIRRKVLCEQKTQK